MLADRLGEITGRVTYQRVIRGDDGMKLETSFQATGTFLGVNVTDVGTYVTVVRADGSLDVVVPQVFRAEHASNSDEFTGWAQWLARASLNRPAIVDLGAYQNSLEGLLRQAHTAVAATGPRGGVSLFSLAATNAPVVDNPLSTPPGRDTPQRPIAHQHRVDRAQQLVGIDGLAQVIVRAGLERDPLVPFRLARGQHDHRHAEQSRIGAHRPQQVDPGQARHGAVEQGKLRRPSLHDRERLVPPSIQPTAWPPS